MTDTTDRLIAAWVAWDKAPRSQATVDERFRAMVAAGLRPIPTQMAVARNRAAGMSIPDAVQAAINEQEPEGRQ